MSKAKETERRQKRETERRQKGAPLDVVRHLLDHVGAQALMRHYRLPGFEGAEGFVQARCLVQHCALREIRGRLGPRPATSKRRRARCQAVSWMGLLVLEA